jgi:hypothetical protein
MDEKTITLDPTKQIMFFSRFYPLSTEGGGCRRTAQLADALKDLEFGFLTTRDYYSGRHSGTPSFQEYLKAGLLPQEFIDKWHPSRRDDVAFMHYVSWLWSNELDNSPSLRLALVDDPIYFAPLVRYLALNNIPTVANCHNLEALSRSQLNAEHQMELFNYEIDILSLCSLVVTISREETVLLRNLGINAFYYPYYPVEDIHDRMLGIRQKRMGSIKEDFLLVGTAHNPPTMKGMQEIMGLWGSLSGSLGGARLYVAGFGSEPLKDFADGKDVVFKGPMSDEDLDNMLVNIRGCIAYQGDGSGALTKICEFLLAGVPVLANSHAARSYYNTPGVLEFTDIHDIARASKFLDSAEMEVPVPGRPDSAALLSKIESLLGDEGTRRASQAKSLAESGLANDSAAAERLKREQANIQNNILQVQAEMKRADEEHRVEIERLTMDINSLIEEGRRKEEYINELLDSLSWKITSPLRIISKPFIERKKK